MTLEQYDSVRRSILMADIKYLEKVNTVHGHQGRCNGSVSVTGWDLQGRLANQLRILWNGISNAEVYWAPRLKSSAQWNAFQNSASFEKCGILRLVVGVCSLH